ncbi:MAG: DUF3365 domain-containing protein [Planctomycetes bacterium]|nr:DUF3365 domain-containing protein [Planctomycetota bacterium]
MRHATWPLVTLAAFSIIGCSGRTDSRQGESAPSEAKSTVLAPGELDDSQQRQQTVALAARDALFEQLLGRLMTVLPEKGPAGAIPVCKEDAPRLADEVGKQFGVAIGRTSHRLRNAANAPRAWSKSLVERQIAEPQLVGLGNGELGVLLPIRLKATCLLCHGPADQIAPEVKAALASDYPDDQATGFQEGDLRGWFWVEVPAGARLPDSSEEDPIERP